MSNYCRILFYSNDDFYTDKKSIIDFYKDNYMYEWDQFRVINIGSKRYWKDILRDFFSRYGSNICDFIYVDNDCSDEGGLFTIEDIQKLAKDKQDDEL